MKSYWDSSALVIATQDADLRRRLVRERGFARTHVLAETFSALTGKMDIRMDADFAVKLLEQMASSLDFSDLSNQEVLSALISAKKSGVRGGRVHDFLHAIAAKKAGADSLLTSDRHDFENLVPGLSVEQV
jgi:predicted nucleic acid-binding protein